jgi:hypothetical protein
MTHIIKNSLILIDSEWYYLEKYLNRHFSKYDIYHSTFSLHWFGYILEKRYENFSWVDEDQINESIREYVYLNFQSQEKLQKFLNMYEGYRQCMME